MSSLPVPVSPRTSTVIALAATRAVASRRRPMTADSNTSRRPMACSTVSWRSRRRSWRASSARSSAWAISSTSKGLGTYS